MHSSTIKYSTPSYCTVTISKSLPVHGMNNMKVQPTIFSYRYNL